MTKAIAFLPSHNGRVPRADEERTECRTSLIGFGNETDARLDWQGRPADDRHDVGGWIASLSVIGAFWLVMSAFEGVVINLVIYLVDVWGVSNATAANTVTNVGGTSMLCSFVGAFASDAYIGRLWGSVLFEIFVFISFLLVTLTHMMATDGSESGGTVSRTMLLCFTYALALTCGSTFPSLEALGADQLHLEQRQSYFTFIAMSISAGQLFATTVVSFLDAQGLWTWGFWLCTTLAGAAVAVTLINASKCLQCRVSGNLLVRVAQVLATAVQNRKVETPLHPSFLHETQGELSAIPGCRKLRHTNFLRCLDKAATKTSDADSPWRLCTVTQVEEVKCLVRVMPMGLATMCLTTVTVQAGTLFVVQGAAMDGELGSGLSIAPASMNLFALTAALLTGLLQTTPCARLLATSLQRLGTGMLLGVVAMVVAAVVEAYHLHVANADGALISIMWLIPQYFLLGIASNLLYSGSISFYYSEVSDGMRSVSTAISLLFQGLGRFLSSAFVSLVMVVTTVDNSEGWIPDDLNNGHVDYFYWLLAAFLTLSSGMFLVYAVSYTYLEVDIYPIEETS